MNKVVLIILFLLPTVFFTFAQSNDQVVIGKIDSIQSEVLDEQRKVWIYLPAGAENPHSRQKYPVVYLLDGSGHFYSVAGMIHQLSSINGNTICPKMIVVAIPNTNRTRDLTPTKGDPDHPYVDEGMLKVSGGGERFISFLRQELIPHIESKYPTAPFRMLIGHSFGGLTVMNAFHKHSDLFNAYVAIDPSMWWGKQQLLEEIKNSTIDAKYKGKCLYVGIANTMEEGMAIEEVRTDTSVTTGHIRAILDMDDYFKANAGDHLKYKGQFYADDDHGSVPLISEYDALRFFFPFYRLKIGPPEIMNPKLDLAKYIKDHYDQVATILGYEEKPEEDMLNWMGYELMNMKQMEKAGGLFMLNTQYYPKSANVYDSLADYYQAAGEKEMAIKNYKKALSINDNPETKAKLEKLEKE